MKNEKSKDVVKPVGAQNLVPVQAEVPAPKELGAEIRPKKLSHNTQKFLAGLSFCWKIKKE